MNDGSLPHPPPTAAAAAAAPGGPWRALWHLLVPVLAMVLLLGAALAALGGTAVWLLRSEDGTRWLLNRVPGLSVKGIQGALLSEHFAAEQVIVRWGQDAAVTIDGLVGSGLRWRWHPAFGAWVGLDAQRLQARRVDVQTGPAGPRPIHMPRNLNLPLRLNAAEVEVGELQIESLAPMRQVQAQRVHLWEPGGREYHAESARLQWGRALIEGQVSLGARAPFTLQAQARARAVDGATPWSAEASALGPLERFELQAHLSGHALREGATPPALDLQSTITPLQAWALGRLRLRVQSFDLSALAADAPQTALSGHADIDSQASGGPIGANVELDNANPGRWDRGRLPLRQITAKLRSPAGERNQLLLDEVNLLFAQGSDPAGRWRANGRWAGTQLQLDSRVDELRPQLIDGRASAMTLTGPVALKLQGFALPIPQDDGSGAASAPRAAAGTAAGVPWKLDAQAQLDGRIDRSPQPVKLQLEGSASAHQFELRRLHAEAGAAQAELSAQGRRGANGGWQLRSQGRLADFDPLPWWPGDEGSAWRAGPHRLSGNWELDLQAPRLQPGVPLIALAQSVAASGHLKIERSLLAGVPMALQLDLSHRTEPGTANGPSRARGELVLAGNRLALDGQGNPLGEGQADRLSLDLQAPELAALAPLLRLHPDLAPWAPRAGRAEATLRLAGRWPALRSEGQLQAQAVQTSALEARQVRANWRFDTGSDDPLLLQLDGQGIALQQQRVEQLHADLRGTWRQHRLELAAALPLQPPLALEVGLGLRTAAGTLLNMQADGQWQGDGSGGGRWSARLAQLALRAWSGRGTEPVAGNAAPWLQGQDLRTEVRVDARDGLAEAQAGAGQVRLGDAVTLRWDEVRMDLRGPHPRYALRADIEPFALAPLLARAQPDLGWTGDLRLAAHVDLKVGDQVEGEWVFERRDGDLRLSDENASAPFGLSEVRLVGQARDGRWQWAGAFAGKTLGEASARLSLQTKGNQRWPSADSPLDGSVQAHVANLGVWGTWVPAGWRVSGELRTAATIGGRLGAPEYTGELSASNVAARNLLEGVDVRDGQLRVRLNGPTADIEQFSLHGGDGRIDIKGQGRFSEPAGWQLQLNADRFRLLGRVDRQLIVSGALNLGCSVGLCQRLQADGRIQVDEGLFDLARDDAPRLDDDVVVRQARSAAAEAELSTPATRARRQQQVAVDLDLGEKLRLRVRGLDTTLGGRLRLGSAAGKTTAHGLVSTSGGTYQAWGQKLEVERGMLSFSGDLENPALDVLALRPNLDIQVGVAITGSAQQPRVRLYSSTDLSESDKLSWLVLGRASEGLGRADTTLLQRAAIALMAGEGEAPTDTLMRSLGLDQFSVRQSDTDVRDTVISLGKQLSRRWYVGYERGVNATAGTWQLIYRIAQRFTLRAQSGLDNSLDVIWTWRTEAPPTPTAAPTGVTQSRPSPP